MVSIYTIEAMKKILGNDYSYHQAKTVEEVKKILETDEMGSNTNFAPFLLQVGSLSIEANIDFGEYDEHGNLTGSQRFDYCCCIRGDNGEWSSYIEVHDKVNIDVPDMEVEMFGVLVKFAEEQGLSFFSQEDEYMTQMGLVGDVEDNDPVFSEDECEDDLEL